MLVSAFSESFFLVRKSFMEEMIDALDEEILYEQNKELAKNRVLTPDAIKFSLIREYFKWLGLFINCRSGRKLLKAANFQSKFVKIAEIEHLAPVLMTVLDFKEQSAQQFLSFCLQSKHKIVKHKALSQLQAIYRAGVFDLSWAIWDLINLLYSPDQDTVNYTLAILNDISQYKENLKILIQTRPQNLLKLGEEGDKCLIKFLSTASGIEYLKELGYI